MSPIEGKILAIDIQFVIIGYSVLRATPRELRQISFRSWLALFNSILRSEIGFVVEKLLKFNILFVFGVWGYPLWDLAEYKILEILTESQNTIKNHEI